jgi:hypothetical protein
LPGVELDRAAAASESFVFRGPIVKRLSAEQFVDAVFALTSSWPAPDPGLMKVDGRGQGGQLGAIALALENSAVSGKSSRRPIAPRRPLKEAKWLWSLAEARQAAPPQTIYLRRVWTLDQVPAQAIATFTADNSFELTINGKSLAKSDNWGAPVQVDATGFLTAGKNVVAVKAVNGGNAPNPAGVIGEIVAFGADGKPAALLATDDSWRVSEADTAGWLKPDFDDSSWKSASLLGDATVDPWNVAQILERAGATVHANAMLPATFRVRAALLPLDSLQAALGRPNREQVVSARDSAPTMLQALELTNGSLLGQYVQRGAAYWHKQETSDAKSLVDRIYQTALGRSPNSAESQLAVEIVGTPATPEGIEDLLWSICMLPEFQLVP